MTFTGLGLYIDAGIARLLLTIDDRPLLARMTAFAERRTPRFRNA